MKKFTTVIIALVFIMTPTLFAEKAPKKVDWQLNLGRFFYFSLFSKSWSLDVFSTASLFFKSLETAE